MPNLYLWLILAPAMILTIIWRSRSITALGKIAVNKQLLRVSFHKFLCKREVVGKKYLQCSIFLLKVLPSVDVPKERVALMATHNSDPGWFDLLLYALVVSQYDRIYKALGLTLVTSPSQPPQLGLIEIALSQEPGWPSSSPDSATNWTNHLTSLSLFPNLQWVMGQRQG